MIGTVVNVLLAFDPPHKPPTAVEFVIRNVAIHEAHLVALLRNFVGGDAKTEARDQIPNLFGGKGKGRRSGGVPTCKFEPGEKTRKKVWRELP